MKVRKLLRDLHRDIGYLAVGLTVIFAVSGIAVNHIHEWNPNYSIVKTENTIEGINEEETQDIAKRIVEKLGLSQKIEGWHRVSPEIIRIFLEGSTIDYNVQTKVAQTEKVNSRFLLREFNILHLNEPKKAWTWFSDFYAVNLIFLAISGMFLLKGRKGMKWRGTWLVTIGVIIPVLFLMYYQ
jgi:hypothetical protein